MDKSAHASDARLVVAARGVRAFVYGMLGVLLGVALSERGLSPVEIGAIITTSLVGDFCGTYVLGLNADRWGRRRTLVVLAALMAMTGVIFGLLSLYPLLLVAGFFGTLGTSASETAPFLPIEQAILPQIVAPQRRVATFAQYNLVASLAGALGALSAGLPDLLTHAGISVTAGIRLMFGLCVLAALLAALLAMRLSPAVETPPLAGAAHPRDGRFARRRPSPCRSLQRRCRGRGAGGPESRGPVPCASAYRSALLGCSFSQPTLCPHSLLWRQSPWHAALDC